MNDTQIREALRNAVTDVLEKMFFTETLGEIDAPPGDPDDQEIAAGLTFQGDQSGCFLLRLANVAARQIAADFLGIEEVAVTDVQTSEVVRELANMVCGSVLSRVESAASFRLDAPRIVPCEEEIARSRANTLYCAALSNGKITVKITAGNAPCPQTAPFAY